MEEDYIEDDSAAVAAAKRMEMLQSFGFKMQAAVSAAVSAKSAVENRWIADMQQWRGEYDVVTKSRLENTGRSTAFVNLTRVKCNAAESRLCEMLMPTDDRNWDIKPTPIPTLAAGEDAKAAAAKMRQKMDDALAECDYNAILRDVIHDAVVLGTGILKGPVIKNRWLKKWGVNSETGEASLSNFEDVTPAAEAVSPWDVFVDPDARTIEDAEYVIQRHRMTKQQLRDLAALPDGAGFLRDAIADVIEGDDRKRQATGLADNAKSDSSASNQVGRFEVWEYHGEISAVDLENAGVAIDSDDPLQVFQGVVWCCNQTVIKAIINPMASAEKPFSFFVWEKDDSSPFGYGVPSISRDSQRVANSAWRMLLDNAALSVMPQIVVNSRLVSPRDGNFTIAPGKTWEMQESNVSVSSAFGVFPVASNMGELVNLFSMAQRFIDDETGLPQIAQGNQSPAITKTAQGMSILMNSANNMLRRLVRQFDEDITRPFLGRLYDWFMQFDDDVDAKGDCQIVPLGSSSLLVREQQTDGLLKLMQLSQSNPTLSMMTKTGELYRKLVQSMNINADGLVMSDEELQQKMQQQQPQTNPADIEKQKLQIEQQKLQIMQQKQSADQQIATAKAQSAASELDIRRQEIGMRQQTEAAKLQIAAREQQIAEATAERVAQMELLKLQSNNQLTAAQIEAARQQTEMTLDSKHQLFNAEAALRIQTGAGI